MNKLSLYDTLGMFFPGAMLLYGLQSINKNWNFYILQIEWKESLIPVALASLLLGAILFAFSFFLVKCKYFRKVSQLYKPVGEIYYKGDVSTLWDAEFLNTIQGKQHKKVHFYSKQAYMQSDDTQKQNAIRQQEDLYDYAYYLLEHEGKNGSVLSNHSLYFFFRQSFIAVAILALLSVILSLVSLATHVDPNCSIWGILPVSILLLLLFSWLGQHYRKRMVHNLYWSYFIYLEKQYQTINP
ncbi:CRISPR-associated protein Csx27 [Prolixibacteraceae bacterium]|nr:CRISPR-associated protein Csx27 [Prolixibacteraceae bacterium]